MKKLLVLAMAAFCLSATESKAQVSVGLNVNIGSQPVWGPVGYDYVDYYYMPDIDVYYNVPTRQYVYYEGNTWVKRASLPPRYVNYNVYNGYKVVVNKPKPYLNHGYYQSTYAKYKGGKGPKQIIIRDSKDEKYKVHHDNGNKGNGNSGNGKGKGKKNK
jgi:hypothetical protein